MYKLPPPCLSSDFVHAYIYIKYIRSYSYLLRRSPSTFIYIYIYTLLQKGNMKRVLPPSGKTQQAFSSSHVVVHPPLTPLTHAHCVSFAHYKIYILETTRLSDSRRILNEKARLNKTRGGDGDDYNGGALFLCRIVLSFLPPARPPPQPPLTEHSKTNVSTRLDRETYLTRAGLGRREDNYNIKYVHTTRHLELRSTIRTVRSICLYTYPGTTTDGN